MIRIHWMWMRSYLAYQMLYSMRLSRFFARFLSHYLKCTLNYLSMDNYFQCHAMSPSFSTLENVILTVAFERHFHQIDLIRSHCNFLQFLRLMCDVMTVLRVVLSFVVQVYRLLATLYNEKKRILVEFIQILMTNLNKII